MSVFEDVIALRQPAQHQTIQSVPYQYTIDSGNPLADFIWNLASEELYPYATEQSALALKHLIQAGKEGPHLRGTIYKAPVGTYHHIATANTAYNPLLDKVNKLAIADLNKASINKSSISKSHSKPVVHKSIIPTRLEMALAKKNKLSKPVKPRPSKKQSVVPKTYSVSNAGAALVSSSGSVRVKHREYISDVFGFPDGSYSSVQYQLNPGNLKAFPWLSTLASRYDRYVVNKMHFLYLPSSSVTTVGSVLLAADMDASDPIPANKVALMSMKNSTRCAPWGKANMCLPVDTIPRYTRSSTVPAGTDVKTYDIANFYIATSGLATSSALGELYVDYDISLFIPHLVPTAFSFNIQPSGTFQGNISDLWRGTDLIRGSLSCGPVLTSGSAGQIYIGVPPGTILHFAYIVKASVSPSTISVTVPAIGGQVVNVGASAYSVQGTAQYLTGFLILVQPIANPDTNHLQFAGQFIASFSAQGTAGTVDQSGTSLSLFVSEFSTFN